MLLLSFVAVFSVGIFSTGEADSNIVSSGVNLALGRPATQSSDFKSGAHGILYASKAVDGNYINTNTNKDFSCSHTNDVTGGPNWWRVQLDRPYYVDKVVVTTRQDCCAERLDYFLVGVTNSAEDPVRGTYALCGQYPSKAEKNTNVTVSCDPNIGAGQYVIIQQPKNGAGNFTLCEVEVYARSSPCDVNPCQNGGTCFESGSEYRCSCPSVYSGKNCETQVNLALGRPATQSSDFNTADYGVLSASKAVDGNYDNSHTKKAFSCSHTKDVAGGPNWWRVQLDRPYRVERVVVTTRQDCCAERLDHFIVGVTNSTVDPVRGTYPLCGQYPSKAEMNAKLTLSCGAKIAPGQYVIIQQPTKGTGELTLCEVEVYARG